LAGSSTYLSDEVHGNCWADPSTAACLDLVAADPVEGILVVASKIHTRDLRDPILLTTPGAPSFICAGRSQTEIFEVSEMQSPY
jgi:hypothetical protein